ncbi:hypothetical protein [Lapidilactobacillus gannanensis]|jgi:hypothetical protein|uniref:Uncharacterized protein n=1 Tax=Lapidilactobacillus gannanensis TaxID=2486002 RepID=A0ABW4BN88_9LACO|nr:hypothetical protein [Lapidilactobacillus gannanensis]
MLELEISVIMQSKRVLEIIFDLTTTNKVVPVARKDLFLFDKN